MVSGCTTYYLPPTTRHLQPVRVAVLGWVVGRAGRWVAGLGVGGWWMVGCLAGGGWWAGGGLRLMSGHRWLVSHEVVSVFVVVVVVVIWVLGVSVVGGRACISFIW